ncbi:MAG: hypothetical protein WAP52_00100, partial [Candidatus Sungiibacteriota bacterium]
MEEENISRNEVKRERAADAARRSRVRKIMIIVAVVLVIGGLAYWGIIASRRGAKDAPGETYANQGQQHVA